ncbi:MAG: hypothetical protein IPL32_03770 [Chloracidobacterium sp.]|nr:hypothetical protein [Chloracidobacterium sp.]
MDKLNLISLLDRRQYDHAVICTFTLDPTFLEDYCLERKALANTPNITVIVDRNVYEQILSDPRFGRFKKANIRYLVLPVAATGVFHTKLGLFLSPRGGSLYIGSCNFTRQGMTENAELAVSVEYRSEDDEEPSPLFRQAYEYLWDIASMTGEANFISNLEEINRSVAWIGRDTIDNAERPQLLSNLSVPLWEQIVKNSGDDIRRIAVLSRYFDSVPNLLDRVYTDLQPDTIDIFTQNGVTNLTPTWFDHRLVREGIAHVYFCNYSSDDYPQKLHGKALAIERDDSIDLYYGSANFSTPALLRPVRSGNAEVLVALLGLKRNEARVDGLFDPDETAIECKDPSILVRAKSDFEELEQVWGRYDFEVINAEIQTSGSEKTLEVQTRSAPVDLELSCLLTFSDETKRTLSLTTSAPESYTSNLTEWMSRKVDDQTAIVQLQARLEDLILVSNPVLLLNLRDFQTNQPVRRTRLMRDAASSSTQFVKVLNELIKSGDDGALLNFFNLCDIPLIMTSRPRLLSVRGAVSAADDAMRTLGSKNLQIHMVLHEAALSFLSRHMKKLSRHTKDRSIGGIENFIQIFLSMGSVIYSQSSRIVVALESTNSVTVQDWTTTRNQIDCYFEKFRELVRCLWGEYLSRLIRETDRETVSERVAPELDQIIDIAKQMLDLRRRVEEKRLNGLIHADSTGRRTVPNYFFCVFGDGRWGRYKNEIEAETMHVTGNIRPSASL